MDDKSDGWKQKYDPKNLKVLPYQPVKLEAKSLADKNRSDLKQPTQLKQINLNEMSQPLWIKLSREDFNSLIKDVVHNLDNNRYKTTVDGNKRDLKNAEKFLLEIFNKKIGENKARKLCDDLIKPETAVLIKAKSKGNGKRNNILNFLDNLESIFTGVHFDHENTPEESKPKRKKQYCRNK